MKLQYNTARTRILKTSTVKRKKKYVKNDATNYQQINFLINRDAS